MKTEFYDDFQTERIGEGNPYYRCVHCKVSVPEINGQLNNHQKWCKYRLSKEKISKDLENKHG